jgi:two-component system, chemotaxis family, CheB/CheR fusion protein
LKPSGFLILEVWRALQLSPTCSPPHKKHTIYSKKAGTSRLHYDFVQSYYPTAIQPDVLSSALKPQGAVKKHSMCRRPRPIRLVLKHYALVGVIVNSAMFRHTYLLSAPSRET